MIPSNLDLSSLTYSDIHPGVSHYNHRIVSRVQNPNHTWSTVTEGYNSYKTPVGELEEKDWDELARELVRIYGDEALLEKVKDHVREHCVWIKEKEVEHYSLSCLVDGVYKVWAERGEFEL